MQDVAYDVIYNVEAYHWWYQVRRSIVHDLIARHCPKGEKLSILDVGCGTGLLLKELARHGEAHGLDFSPRALDFCRERALPNVRLGEVTRITHPDESFDLVLALDILEHVQDDRGGLAEIRRVLKPGGVCILFVPAFRFLWGINDDLSQHVRRYTRAELVAKSRDEGLEVVRSSYFNTFLFLPIAAVRLLVRLFRLPMKSENRATGSGLLNRLLHGLFYAESRLLKAVNFPIGVSALVVGRKPDRRQPDRCQAAVAEPTILQGAP